MEEEKKDLSEDIKEVLKELELAEAQLQPEENDEGEEEEMTYEEYLIYSARIGDLEQVQFCVDEEVDLNTQDDSKNTALRKLLLLTLYLGKQTLLLQVLILCRYGERKWKTRCYQAPFGKRSESQFAE